MPGGADMLAIGNAAIGQTAASSPAKGYADQINSPMVVDSAMSGFVDDIARAYPTKQGFAKVAEEIASGITDKAKQDAFIAAAKAKINSWPPPQPTQQQRTGRSSSDATDRAGGDPRVARGGANTGGNQLDEISEIDDQLSALSRESQNLNVAGETSGGKKSEASQQAYALDSEYRTQKNYFEQADQGLDQLKRSIAEGWSQLKLFGDEIAKKQDYADFADNQVRQESQRWYMNWLWVSIGNTKNNMRKILAFLILRFLSDAAAIRETRGSSPQLELGSLDNITQPPSFSNALQLQKELEGLRSKYDNEAARLAEKERTDIPEYERKAAEYKRQAEESRQQSEFQKKLSAEAQQAIEANRAKTARLREDYERLEKRKKEIAAAASRDPQAIS